MDILVKSYADFVKGNVLKGFKEFSSAKPMVGITKAQAVEQFGADAEIYTKEAIEQFEKAVLEKCNENPDNFKQLWDEGYKQLEGLQKSVIEGQVFYIRKKGE